MADERNKWLDRKAVEQLLAGASVELPADADEHSRAQAHRLRTALDSVVAGRHAACSGSFDGEMPGEKAALEAFRESRAAAPAGTAPVPPPEPRPRWRRPVRAVLAVALAGCTLGGVAYATGGGALTMPFSEDGRTPSPGATVSTAVTPGPLVTRPPGGAPSGGADSGPADGSGGGDGRGGAETGTGRDASPGAGARRPDGSAGPAGPDGEWPGADGTGDGAAEQLRGAVAAGLCEDYRREGPEGLRDRDRDALRRLERAAGGADKVAGYCARVLTRERVDGQDEGPGGGEGPDGDGGFGGGAGDDTHDEGLGAPGAAPADSAPDGGAGLTTLLVSL
ncbi:hypothetical protein [Streptomyces sp. GC420]|uniref:hypothetical protein n=1 Tax=Streptomyces sp. GC420 TaxID=2697568 RepID=UPI001414E1B2|nr:hypothetical protein [Streptomyces sp. GC420]NBM16193.1 hypothetical protein [Streptomyces sp. GC420]